MNELNPQVEVDVYVSRLDTENADSVIEKYDIVIDGTDNFSSRYLIGDVCEKLGKPWVFGSIHRFEGQVSTFNFEAGPNYRDLFPVPPPPELAPNCSEAGVLGMSDATAGYTNNGLFQSLDMSFESYSSGVISTIDEDVIFC